MNIFITRKVATELLNSNRKAGGVHGLITSDLPQDGCRTVTASTMWRSLLPALLCLALLVGLPTAVQAQTQTLVSNLNIESVSGGYLTKDHAQAFTTGGNSAGYILNSVDLLFIHTSTTANGNVTVTIRNDDSGSPSNTSSDILGTLTGTFVDSMSDPVVTFTPAAGISLAANTTYWFVFDVTDADAFGAGTGDQRNTHKTAFSGATSNNEDASSASGWSIADELVQRSRDSTGAWAKNPLNQSMKLRINGVVNPTGFSTPLIRSFIDWLRGFFAQAPVESLDR